MSLLDFAYYPGCSLEGLSREYDASFRAVCQALGIGLKELAGWNCCGGSSAHAVDTTLALTLASRNLDLAGKEGKDLVIPCAACYHNLRQAEREKTEGKTNLAGGRSPGCSFRAPRQEVGEELPGPVVLKRASGVPQMRKTGEDGASSADVPRGKRPTVRLFHVNDFLVLPSVYERVKQSVHRQLSGLRAVTYYGCLVPRSDAPPGAVAAENPTSMDQILILLGITVRKWTSKVDCCGGSLGVTRPAVVRRLVADLLIEAHKAGANCMVTACPMCFVNLDGRQPEVLAENTHLRPLPVFYVTELVGLALGLHEVASWWRRHCVDPRPLVDSLELQLVAGPSLRPARSMPEAGTFDPEPT